MTSIMVMIPAGEVYDHNNVRWYDYQNVARNLEHYHNIGDAFVYDSSLKLLNFDRLEVLNIVDVTAQEIDRINAEFDYVFLRGSNYLNAEMTWWNCVEILPRIKIPIIALGIGAQARQRGRVELSAETQRVMRIIGDSTPSVGVRGAYTEEVLSEIGVHNVRIVGCPTAFRRNDRDLKITLPSLSSVRDVGFTVRREISEDYARSVGLYLVRQREAIKAIAARFDVELLMQGEIEEKKLLWGSPEQQASTWRELKSHAWMGRWFFDDTIENLWRTKLFYSDVVADFEARVAAKDLVLGFRLHGNLLALANGVPSVYFTYDSRTAEFAETFRIPSYDIYSNVEFALENYWEQSQFDQYNQAWLRNYDAMAAFLNENHVSHLMHPPGA